MIHQNRPLECCNIASAPRGSTIFTLPDAALALETVLTQGRRTRAAQRVAALRARCAFVAVRLLALFTHFVGTTVTVFTQTIGWQTLRTIPETFLASSTSTFVVEVAVTVIIIKALKTCITVLTSAPFAKFLVIASAFLAESLSARGTVVSRLIHK